MLYNMYIIIHVHTYFDGLNALPLWSVSRRLSRSPSWSSLPLRS